MTLKNLGQFFTTNPVLQQTLFDWIRNEPDTILEPSVGRGDIVKYIESKGLKVNWELYEIDTTIDFVINKERIHFGNFLEQSLPRNSFLTIVGNPPYVKIKERRNLYLDFIEKCVDLLCSKGELIFIVPSDFFVLTSAQTVLGKMFDLGYFTDLFYPNDEHLFTKASVDVMVFRYVKDKYKSGYDDICNYNNIPGKIKYSDGIVRIYDMNFKPSIVQKSVSEVFDVFVGMVSGKDDIFRSERYGNISILKKQNYREKFIYIENFPSESEELNNYLISHKPELTTRKIIKITERNWFKWGAPRNINIIKTNFGKKCIYVQTLTRSDQIAFVGEVEFFSGNLLLLIPKTGNEQNIYELINYLNSPEFKVQHTFADRFKITHRQLSHVLF